MQHWNMGIREEKFLPRRSISLLLTLGTLALSGCSSSSGDETVSAQFTTSTPTPTVSLPPGAEDVWDLGLTGNMVADMGTYYEEIEDLDGQDGKLTATRFAEHRVEEICAAETEDRVVGGSELDMGVRMFMGNSEFAGPVSTGIIRVAASYGCPERADLVDEAIDKAHEFHNS